MAWAGDRAIILQKLSLAIVFLWFSIGGVCHFIFASAFVRVVPPYLPWPLALVYVSGVFELLGAGGLLIPRLRGLAAWGLFALTIAVTPANIYMWQTPALVPSIPQSILGWRLVLQVLLLATIAFVAIRARRRGI